MITYNDKWLFHIAVKKFRVCICSINYYDYLKKSSNLNVKCIKWRIFKNDYYRAKNKSVIIAQESYNAICRLSLLVVL